MRASWGLLRYQPGRSQLGSLARGARAVEVLGIRPGIPPRGSDEDTRVPARPREGLQEVLVREFTPWSHGEVRAPLRVTAVGPVRVGRGEERQG